VDEVAVVAADDLPPSDDRSSGRSLSGSPPLAPAVARTAFRLLEEEEEEEEEEGLG
jgi:hypothetical protein